VFLLAAAWPAIARTLELGDPEREQLLDDLTRRVLMRSAYEAASTL